MRGRKAPKQPIYFPPRHIVTRQSTDTIAVDDPDVSAVARFIRDHACEGIRIEAALAASSVSRSTLTRRFKSLLNRTPMAHLTHIRIETAKQLLLETDLTVATISERCGFTEPKYFVEAFHRVVREPPGRFRKSQA